MKDLYIRPVKRGFLVRSGALNRDVALFTSLYEAQNFINNFSRQIKGTSPQNYDYQSLPYNAHSSHNDNPVSNALALPSNLPSAVKNYNNNYFVKRTNEGFLVSMRTNRGDSDIALFRTNDDALFFIKMTANIATIAGNNINNNGYNGFSANDNYLAHSQNLLPSSEYDQNRFTNYPSQEVYLENSGYHNHSSSQYASQPEVYLGVNGVQTPPPMPNQGYPNQGPGQGQYVAQQPEVQLGANGVQQPLPMRNQVYPAQGQYMAQQPEVQLGANGIQQQPSPMSNQGYPNQGPGQGQYVAQQPEVQLGANGVQQQPSPMSNQGYPNQGPGHGQYVAQQPEVQSEANTMQQSVPNQIYPNQDQEQLNAANIAMNEQFINQDSKEDYNFSETVNFSDVNFLDSNEETTNNDVFEFDGDHVQSIFEKMMEEENYSKSQLKKMNREAEKKGKKDLSKAA